MAGLASATINLQTLPPDKQLIIDSGINLIELRLTKQFFNNQRRFGWWDVRVSEQFDGRTMRARYNTRWFQDDGAYVEFVTDSKRGVCTGYVPDDPSWHNRTSIASVMDSGDFTIEKVHTSNGIVPRDRIVGELRAVRNYLEEYIIEFRDEYGIETIERRKTSQECDKYIRDIVSKDRSLAPKYTYRMSKIKAVEELVTRYGCNWITSDEFQKEHRPNIEAVISSTVKPAQSTMLDEASVASAFEAMPPDVLRRILVRAGLAVPDPTATAPSALEANPVEPIKGVNENEGKGIEQMSRNELIRTARGLETSGVEVGYQETDTKVMLIQKIKTAIQRTKAPEGIIIKNDGLEDSKQAEQD